ncbi:MAG TPA: hypothetical protein VHC43_15800 [Mycobacteriales bacterium]|nr:hypothetical protein [Mycobacteriales bacterium]
MSARSRLSSAFDGLGPYAGIAAVLFVLALLMFLLIVQSQQDMLLWTGGRTVGTETNGLVRFRVDGQSYTFVPDQQSSADKPRVEVYYKKSDPFAARLDSTSVRVLDLSFTIAPLLVAAGVVGLGLRRRARGRTSPARAESAFGTGLDPDFVQRQLDQLRRPQ